MQAHSQTQESADGTPVKEVAPFLRSLRRMLDTESPYIVRWTPDGKAFEIYDIIAISDYVLPKYFKHCKYASFQRQLNYFNFRKWTKSRADLTFRSNVRKQEEQAPLALPTPGLQLFKQFDPVVTVQTTVGLERIDGDASLAWIDALYPELDLGGQLDDNDRVGPDYSLSTALLSL
ncbi:unnamed protein product [Peronospora effusa]|nr:unnamed protein product [Peronospora effusa]